MAATVTTLDRAIAREERHVGLPTNQPLTDAAIARRRAQIVEVLVACGCVAILGAVSARGLVRVLAIVIALAFGAYAIEKDRHLRRLALLRGDSKRITLVVASELMHSGALAGDRELLDLRDGIGQTAGRLAAGLAEAVSAESVRVRLLGPSGELPIAAEREFAARRTVPRDADIARDALRTRAAVRTVRDDGRGVLVVPMWRGDDLIALLEAVSEPGGRFLPRDAAVVDAYARGAIAALRAPR